MSESRPMTVRKLPPEFLQPAEFQAMTGYRQKAAWRRWLDGIGVRYIQTPDGYPLVYRDKLSPGTEAPGAKLNLSALHASRKAA